MAYLKIENLYKTFGETKVLKGINLEVNKGEVVSILGSSGSGKTTLLRCINFWKPLIAELWFWTDKRLLTEKILNRNLTKF